MVTLQRPQFSKSLDPLRRVERERERERDRERARERERESERAREEECLRGK